LLERASLTGTKLGKAKLRGANLSGANLSNADLREASLLRTTLRSAIVQDAWLSTDGKTENVTGLLSSQLVDSNLSGAKVPETIGKFEALPNIQEGRKNATTLFISLLAACLYSALTIATTTDAGLLTNKAASATLPNISVPIPIVAFYWVAPVLLCCLYVYFLLNRQWDTSGAVIQNLKLRCTTL
jgi:hypothetical protein